MTSTNRISHWFCSSGQTILLFVLHFVLIHCVKLFSLKSVLVTALLLHNLWPFFSFYIHSFNIEKWKPNNFPCGCEHWIKNCIVSLDEKKKRAKPNFFVHRSLVWPNCCCTKVSYFLYEYFDPLTFPILKSNFLHEFHSVWIANDGFSNSSSYRLSQCGRQ